MEQLYGTVIRVQFFNDENGYGVVRLRLNYQDHKIAKYKAKLFSNQLTIQCVFDREPLQDEEYDFEGEFVTTQYGLQFKASRFSRRTSETLEGVISYLSSDLFPTIGRVKAKKIFDKLGSKCLEMIHDDPTVLDKVEGLTTEQKDIIYQGLVANQQFEQICVGLTNLGLTMNMARKIYGELKEKSLDIVKENPYRLIDLVEGIGFIRADRIASLLEIPPSSPLRIKAYISFYLNGYINNSGNTYIEACELFNRICEQLNNPTEVIDKQLFTEMIDALSEEKKLFKDDDDNIFEYNTYNSEKLLASKVCQMLSSVYDYGYQLSNIEQALAKVTEKNKITYNDKQLQAIKMSLKENIVIITGGPGTGKSTVIKGIIDTYVELIESDLIKEEIALLAPTGRASKRLNEVTNHPAQTIHRFLGYYGENQFRYGPDAPIDARLVIIDEVSMVDINVCARLFASLANDTKVVLVGDVDQLPSVGPGEVLANLINCGEITTIRLDKIHRQAADSTIVTLAHDINNGLLPENILEKQHDRNFISLADEDILENIIKVIKQGVATGMDLIKDIQVLVPMYRGELGINYLNEKLQEAFNPLDGEEVANLSRKFRVNDKVIQLVNRPKKGVMNGDIGTILSFSYHQNKIDLVTVLFDNGPVEYKLDELEDISHAYAISIHKSQGSEFALVVIPFSPRYYIMLRRKLIYTAITRAKKYLIMLGNINSLYKGTNQIEFNRKTKLINYIKDILSSPKNDISPYDFLD